MAPLWLKAFHIIAVVCWFAGLFYLPRLFVYHVMSEDETSRQRFIIMERKLYRAIMTPSAIVAVVLGFCLYFLNLEYYLASPWMHFKLFFVFLLLIYHGLCRHYLILLREGRNARTHLWFRWFNEFPSLMLVIIVILAVVRPL